MAGDQPSRAEKPKAIRNMGQWHGPNCAVNLATGNYSKFSDASKGP